MASMPSRSARLAPATNASRIARQSGRIERARRRLALLVRHIGRPLRHPAAFGHRNQLAAVPRRVARGLAAGMRELHRDRGLGVLAHRGDDRLQRRFGGVVAQAEAARRDAADRLDGGGLDAEHRCPRQRQIVDVGEVPVIGLAVVAEYWHIGATMMRLGSVRPRSLIGENRALIRGFPDGREARKSHIKHCVALPTAGADRQLRDSLHHSRAGGRSSIAGFRVEPVVCYAASGAC